MKRYDYLILGGGIAALSAAEAIRASDGKGSVAMLSEESRPPYVRPMLTKLPLAHYRVENTLSRPAEWYRSENIDLFLNTRVTGLIPGEKRVCTEQGDFAYGKCIYALGAVNFIPPFRGKDLPGVCDLRSYEGHIDLSIGTTVSFSAVLFATLVTDKPEYSLLGFPVNPYLAMLIVLIVCAGLGAIKGSLVVGTNMPALIATLAVSTALEGVNLLITNAMPISGIPESIHWLGRGFLFNAIPMPIVIFLAIVLVAGFILRFTYIGR